MVYMAMAAFVELQGVVVIHATAYIPPLANIKELLRIFNSPVLNVIGIHNIVKMF